MVTWGSNTTATFGTGTPAAAPTTPAPATGFAFGGGAPSTPPAASTPAPSNPPPLGGSTATTTAPSGGLFGAPAPAGGGLFGSTPAPAPAGGLFGSTPAPAGGLFGSTPAPAPTGGLFGATTAPAPAGGLFGSTPAPAPAGGLFGAPAPAPAGGLFGATPAPAPSAFGAFGTQQQPQQPHPQQANPHLHAHRQEAARIEEAIFGLHSKYSPNAADPLNPALASNNLPSSLCAFTAILYDPLPPEHRAQGHLSVPKPPHISNQVWNEALARNPDPKELAPVALVGAPALHSRIVAQQEKANALAAHAKKLRETLQFLEKAARSSREAIQHSDAEQEALRRRLLEVMRKVEIVRCMGQATQPAEVEAQKRLGEIVKQVNAVGKSLSDLEERGRHQARAWRMRGATMGARRSEVGSASLQEEDKTALFHVLNDQRLGMERLGHIVKRDVRDVGIIKEELNKSAAGGAKALPPSGAAIFGGR